MLLGHQHVRGVLAVFVDDKKRADCPVGKMSLHRVSDRCTQRCRTAGPLPGLPIPYDLPESRLLYRPSNRVCFMVRHRAARASLGLHPRLLFFCDLFRTFKGLGWGRGREPSTTASTLHGRKAHERFLASHNLSVVAELREIGLRPQKEVRSSI